MDCIDYASLNVRGKPATVHKTWILKGHEVALVTVHLDGHLEEGDLRMLVCACTTRLPNGTSGDKDDDCAVREEVRLMELEDAKRIFRSYHGRKPLAEMIELFCTSSGQGGYFGELHVGTLTVSHLAAVCETSVEDVHAAAKELVAQKKYVLIGESVYPPLFPDEA
jgi:hypothetical protein